MAQVSEMIAGVFVVVTCHQQVQTMFL